jgi:hypothetical protein
MIDWIRQFWKQLMFASWVSSSNLPARSGIYPTLGKAPLSICWTTLYTVSLRPSHLRCNNVKRWQMQYGGEKGTDSQWQTMRTPVMGYTRHTDFHISVWGIYFICVPLTHNVFIKPTFRIFMIWFAIQANLIWFLIVSDPWIENCAQNIHLFSK